MRQGYVDQSGFESSLLNWRVENGEKSFVGNRRHQDGLHRKKQFTCLLPCAVMRNHQPRREAPDACMTKAALVQLQISFTK
jgi:hypothetical protein